VVNSDTSITVFAPPGSGTVDITVTTPQGTSLIYVGDQFTYLSIPPPPPPSPSILPPTQSKGVQIKNAFLTQTDIINVITWHAPTSGVSPLVYNIYRDQALKVLAASVPAGGPLEFMDHNRRKKTSYTYYIVSLGPNGVISTPAKVVVLSK